MGKGSAPIFAPRKVGSAGGVYQDPSPELSTKENNFNMANSHAPQESLQNLLLTSTSTAQMKPIYSFAAEAGRSAVRMQPGVAINGSQKESAGHDFHNGYVRGLRTALRPANSGSHAGMNE